MTINDITPREPALALFKNTSVFKNASPAAVKRFTEAFSLSIATHSTVPRKSGESYYRHDCRVAARVMSWFDHDLDLVTAVLLHEFIEDDGYTEEMLKNDFGESITNLVVAVTKSPKKQFGDDRLARLEDHIERMKKMIPHDWRVVAIKIGDRLENTTDTAGLSDEDKENLFSETESHLLPHFRWAVQHVPIEYQKVIKISIQEIEFACDNYWRSCALQM